MTVLMTIIFLPNLEQYSVIIYNYNLVPVKPPQSEKNKRNEKIFALLINVTLTVVVVVCVCVCVCVCFTEVQSIPPHC